MSTDHDERVIGAAKLYEEAGQAWRHFASWRDKAFAGYLTALGAFGYALSAQKDPWLRSAIFLGGILVSVVFWAFENRSRQLMNKCQLAAHSLEQGRGCYSELNRARYERQPRPDEGTRRHRLRRFLGRFWSSVFTYGGAVGLLVSGVSAGSLGGILHYGAELPPTGVVCAVLSAFVLLPLLLHRLASNEYAADRARYDELTKADAKPASE